jgi:hypothetical protein
VLAGVGAALALTATAAAAPPTLASVDVQNRRPTATFSAPRASSVTVYIASAPDRATNGRFFDENIKDVAFLTSSEIQGGQWVSDSQLDPGIYYVMLDASADFASCFLTSTGALDPTCADGFSQVLPLTVPKPRIVFSTSTRRYRFLEEVDLRLTARPLGERLPYRLCFANAKGTRRCLSGVLNGLSWNSSATDTLSVRTRGLGRFTAFRWLVGGKTVATRRVRTN